MRNLGKRAWDGMRHSEEIVPCSQDGDLMEEQIIARASNDCWWTIPVLTGRGRYFWGCRALQSGPEGEHSEKGLPVKCAQSNGSMAARVEKWGRLFVTIRLMPDTALCGHIITRRYQPTLFISHSNLEKKNSATITGPRSGQTQSWPSPKQGRLCLGPCLHEVPQREGKVEGRKDARKDGGREGRMEGSTVLF